MTENTPQLKKPLVDYNELVKINQDNGYESLSAQQKAFAHSYLESYSISESAESVGISPSTGSKWFRDPLVNAYIADIQAEYQRRSVVDADFVRTQWLKVLPKVLGEEEVPMILSDGTQIFGRKFHSADASKVLTELSKSTKFYDGGSGNTGGVTINIDLAALGVANQEKVIQHEGD